MGVGVGHTVADEEALRGSLCLTRGSSCWFWPRTEGFWDWKVPPVTLTALLSLGSDGSVAVLGCCVASIVVLTPCRGAQPAAVAHPDLSCVLRKYPDAFRGIISVSCKI